MGGGRPNDRYTKDSIHDDNTSSEDEEFSPYLLYFHRSLFTGRIFNPEEIFGSQSSSLQDNFEREHVINDMETPETIMDIEIMAHLDNLENPLIIQQNEDEEIDLTSNNVDEIIRNNFD